MQIAQLKQALGGLITLAVGLLLVWGIKYWWSTLEEEAPTLSTEQIKAMKAFELEQRTKAAQKAARTARYENYKSYGKHHLGPYTDYTKDSLSGHRTKHPKAYYTFSGKNLKKFNPNTVDSLTLQTMGFSPFFIHNLRLYQRKGWTIRHEEDLKEIYGMDSVNYTKIKPYITLKKKAPPSITKIHLDEQDTALWSALPYVGSKRALSIVHYGEQLGGYTSFEQLLEVWQLDSTAYKAIRPYLLPPEHSPKQLAINFASIYYMAKHPYITVEEAQVIYEIRQEGQILDFEQLEHSLLEARFQDKKIGQKDLISLRPYLNFSTTRPTLK